MVLYSSKHFVLSEIRHAGKKETGGILCFHGLPSLYGSEKEVLAVEDGVVIFSGRQNTISSRDHKLGIFVRILGGNGVSVTYGRLSRRVVMEGERVRRGQIIGYEGSTGCGSEDYLMLEFRRNGRRIDACGYLGIKPRPTEFCPPSSSPADIVVKQCGLSGRMRAYIDCHPEAEELWKRLLGCIDPSISTERTCGGYDSITGFHKVTAE